MAPPSRARFAPQQWRITRGALTLLAAELVLSIVGVFGGRSVSAWFAEWVIATPSNVFGHGRVWTLVTSPLVEPNFISLVLSVLVLWSFVPTLERFWGTPRFYRFVAVTSVIGSATGVVVGQLLGTGAPITGLSPFVYASIVAFGIIYARQPVRLAFAVEMTGRQLMWGFVGFVVLFVVLQQFWEAGASYAGGMISAAVITSKKWSPALAWKRWRVARLRAKLSVLEGGAGRTKRNTDEKFLN